MILIYFSPPDPHIALAIEIALDLPGHFALSRRVRAVWVRVVVRIVGEAVGVVCVRACVYTCMLRLVRRVLQAARRSSESR